MSLSPFEAPLSHILCGIQLGTIDALVMVCLITITAKIPDVDGRMFLRGILFICFLAFQLGAGGISADKGGKFWDPVLEVGYVVLGVMFGALAVYKVYIEAVRKVEPKKQEKAKA